MLESDFAGLPVSDDTARTLFQLVIDCFVLENVALDVARSGESTAKALIANVAKATGTAISPPVNLADGERLIAATVGMIEEGTPMRRSELLTRVSAATCSAQRRADVTALVDAGRINSPDVLRFTLTSNDVAFGAFCEQIGIEASKRGKGGSQPMAEPDEDDEATLSKIGALAGLTATADGTKQISAKKLRKALAEKRAADTCDVDTSSLKRNGLADDYDAAKKRAHAPQPLGTATRADPRALSVVSGSTVRTAQQAQSDANADEMARVTSSLAEYRNPTSPKK